MPDCSEKVKSELQQTFIKLFKEITDVSVRSKIKEIFQIDDSTIPELKANEAATPVKQQVTANKLVENKREIEAANITVAAETQAAAPPPPPPPPVVTEKKIEKPVNEKVDEKPAPELPQFQGELPEVEVTGGIHAVNSAEHNIKDENMMDEEERNLEHDGNAEDILLPGRKQKDDVENHDTKN